MLVLLDPPENIPRILLAVNPTILLLLLGGVGAMTAQKAGLRSALILKDSIDWRRVGRVAVVALTLGMIVAFADHVLRRSWRDEDLWIPKTLIEAATAKNLGLGVTYGAITEELLMRWGLMSGIMLWLMKYVSRANAAVIALSFAALLFAAGHLPALVASGIELTPALLIRIFVINAGLGAWFGWLYFRENLEAAMAAHGGFHIGAFVIGWLWL